MASCTKRILRATRLSGFHMDCRTLVSGVEATNGFDDWGQCVRNYRIGGDGHALYTIHFVVIDFRLEGSPDITRNAAESDQGPARRYPIHVQTLRLKPGGYDLDVLLGESEAISDFLRGEPIIDRKSTRLNSS